MVDFFDAYEVADDILVFVGIVLVFFGQLWGALLIALGLGIMYLKGEISLGGGEKKELSKEEEKFFQYTSGEGAEEEGEEGEGEGEE